MTLSTQYNTKADDKRKNDELCRDTCENIRILNGQRSDLVRKLIRQSDTFERELRNQYASADEAEDNVKKSLAEIISDLARLGRGSSPKSIAQTVFNALRDVQKIADSFPAIRSTLRRRDADVGRLLTRIEGIDRDIGRAVRVRDKHACRC